MNFADGLRPALIMEDFPEAVSTGPLSGPAQPTASNATAIGPRLSAQWPQALRALEDLRQSLDRHKVMDAYPDIAHDFIAVLAAIEALRGDALFETFWRAQLVRLATQHPNMKDPLPGDIVVGARGSVYAHQGLPRAKPKR